MSNLTRVNYAQLSHTKMYLPIAEALRQIRNFERQDDYVNRGRWVLVLLGEAARANIGHGLRIDPYEPDWPVVLVDLPTGQVTWHMKQCSEVWDGHSSDEKWRRVAEFLGETDGHE